MRAQVATRYRGDDSPRLLGEHGTGFKIERGAGAAVVADELQFEGLDAASSDGGHRRCNHNLPDRRAATHDDYVLHSDRDDGLCLCIVSYHHEDRLSLSMTSTHRPHTTVEQR